MSPSFNAFLVSVGASIFVVVIPIVSALLFVSTSDKISRS